MDGLSQILVNLVGSCTKEWQNIEKCNGHGMSRVFSIYLWYFGLATLRAAETFARRRSVTCKSVYRCIRANVHTNSRQKSPRTLTGNLANSASVQKNERNVLIVLLKKKTNNSVPSCVLYREISSSVCRESGESRQNLFDKRPSLDHILCDNGPVRARRRNFLRFRFELVGGDEAGVRIRRTASYQREGQDGGRCGGPDHGNQQCRRHYSKGQSRVSPSPFISRSLRVALLANH